MTSCWIALGPLDSAEALQRVGWWALSFTPRVALEPPVVLMEVRASLRLMGGPVRMGMRITHEAQAQGVPGAAVASTAAAAQACLLAHPGAWPADWPGDWQQELPIRLDALPLAALPALAVHQSTLSPLGCRTLGDVRALPRAGLARRLGSAPLRAIDQAYGQHPEAFDWWTLPDRFTQSCELPGRVEHAAGMQHAAEHLLVSLCGWLRERHAGIRHLRLSWRHEGHRRTDASGAHLDIHMADPSRDLGRMQRLLREHLQSTRLAAPVGQLALDARDIVPLPDEVAELFGRETAAASAPSGRHQRRDQIQLHTLLERLAARLGPDQVLRGQALADHRPERAQSWQRWSAEPSVSVRPPCPEAFQGPQPTWLVHPPQRLGLCRHAGLDQPEHLGPLRLLSGPHRIEAGWWDVTQPAVMRDYYIAYGQRAGLLWIFHSTRWHQDDGGSPWYLHGVFA